MGKTHYITSESPYQKMWDTFVYFESEPTTKIFLQDIYEKNGFSDGYKFAFQNTSKFIYFIKQSKAYFHSADKSDILVRPLLIYYGMMSLIKAYILTKDPSYPSNTGVLRHGITTRKLKKQNFQFHEDEVKIQKEGLLPTFYSLITNNPPEKIEGNKYKIKELLSLIPELHDSFYRLFKEQHVFPVSIKDRQAIEQTQLYVSGDVLKWYQGNKRKLVDDLNGFSTSKKFNLEHEDTEYVKLMWKKEVNNNDIQTQLIEHPMFVTDFKGKVYLRPYKESRLLLPELMIDYMLMYNLGMLCRYDTELWGEIIFSFTSEDMYIINELLNVTLRRFPNFLLNALFDETFIFRSI